MGVNVIDNSYRHCQENEKWEQENKVKQENNGFILRLEVLSLYVHILLWFYFKTHFKGRYV